MRILLVEDDRDMVELMEIYLGELAGWQVTAYHSAEAVLAESDTLGAPDLALVDLRMDGMSGPALLEELRRLGRCGFPVLYLTGRPPSEAELLLVEGWIQKPFTYDELMAQLREKLGHRIDF